MISEYLSRLGLDRREPTVDYLIALHRAQVERVPYENLEIMLGRPTTVDPGSSIQRIVAGRGGYCFHLNGAFGMLLRGLGFTVGLHVGGVHSRGEEPVGPTGNHLVLTVSGLPAPQCPDGVWFVDSGLGDALHDPLPLISGDVVQGPFRYRLDPSTVIEGGWHFTHDEGGSFGGMDFGPRVVDVAHFAPNHADLSSPGGHFGRIIVAQRRDGAGCDILRDALVTRWDAAGKEVRQIDDAQEWRAVWGDVFGVSLTPDEVDRLWPGAVKRTRVWLAVQPDGSP